MAINLMEHFEHPRFAILRHVVPANTGYAVTVAPHAEKMFRPALFLVAGKLTITDPEGNVEVRQPGGRRTGNSTKPGRWTFRAGSEDAVMFCTQLGQAEQGDWVGHRMAPGVRVVVDDQFGFEHYAVVVHGSVEVNGKARSVGTAIKMQGGTPFTMKALERTVVVEVILEPA